MEDNSNVINGGRKMSQSSSSSTSYILGLTDELLVEILCRLDSSKNATRCKSICKRWFSIIDTNSSSDTYFTRRWRKIHRLANKEEKEELEEELPIALLTQYVVGRTFVRIHYHVMDYPCKSHYRNLLSFKNLARIQAHIVAIHKDLVVFCPGPYDHSVYYLCNPFTKQLTVLPLAPPPPEHFTTSRVQVKIFFSEEEGSGFKFKLARVMFRPVFDRNTFTTVLNNAKRLKVEILSFGEDGFGEWKEMVNVPTCLYSPDSEVLVWLNSSELFYFSSSQEVVGLKFTDSDAIVDSYTRFSLPSGYRSHKPGSLIGVCRGCLQIAQVVYTGNGNNPKSCSQKLIIWQLDVHSKSWNLVHELDFSEVEDSADSSPAKKLLLDRNRSFRTSVLAFDPHDRDIVYLGWFCDDNPRITTNVESYIFLCDVRQRTLKLIRKISALRNSCVVFPLLQPFWPTSVPPLVSSCVVKGTSSHVR